MAEAQALSHSSQPSSGTPILRLSDEVLQLISSHLSNRDIKKIRLVSKRFTSAVTLRIERVFISPSYKNIEVLLAVAGNTRLRDKVKEIVWDDARFQEYLSVDGEAFLKAAGFQGAFRKNMHAFELACEENLSLGGGTESGLVRARTLADPPITDDLMSVDANFALYNKLYDEQEEIIEDGLDVEALRKGLSAFSSLERVTITSAAHRIAIHAPRYPTPMIRSFPPSFNYPIPWPWSKEREQGYSPLPLGEDWRGFTIVLEELANCQRSIPEFVIDVNREAAGIAYQFFETESYDFCNFETLCGRELKRLDLAVNVENFLSSPGLQVLPNGPLKRALSAAISMQHFSLHASTTTRDECDDEEFDGCTDALQVIPVDEWRSLEHLTISHLPLKAPELLAFFKKLPPTIKSLEMIDVVFCEGTWAEVIRQVRDELLWTGGNPKITIANSMQVNPVRRVWICDEVARYLDGGDNPFVGTLPASEIQSGFGTIRDDFDESVEIPFDQEWRMRVQISPGVWETRRRDAL